MQSSTGESYKFKTFRYLKTNFKANKTTKRNAFIIDHFEVLSDLKIFKRLKLPKTLGATTLVSAI